MQLRLGLLGALLLAGLTGCGTVREPYIPKRLGSLHDQKADQGIRLTLSPDKYRARIGEPVTFTVLIENTRGRPALLPADPGLLLAWIYPDGRRDNMVRSQEPVPRQEPLLLNPGEQRVARLVVPTYYFNFDGIYEFRAILRGQPLPVESDAVWTGRALSNGYGIYFDHP